MRKKIVAGNWKMNKNYEESTDFFTQISQIQIPNNVQLIIFPPALYIANAINVLKNKIQIGAQNCHYLSKGAFTGEISPQMLSSIGAKAVIIGHSERRQFFNETNEILTQKVSAVLDASLTLVFCCGESLSERESGKHFNVVESQLKDSLFQLSAAHFTNVVIAYEPVWAIGTGKTAATSDAQEMHAFIRTLLAKSYNTSIAENTSILYGGSCNALNSKELFSQPDIDGGLIGGASLNLNEFLAIANSF
jgi:triosephosphate isomerase